LLIVKGKGFRRKVVKLSMRKGRLLTLMNARTVLRKRVMGGE